MYLIPVKSESVSFSQSYRACALSVGSPSPYVDITNTAKEFSMPRSSRISSLREGVRRVGEGERERKRERERERGRGHVVKLAYDACQKNIFK